MNHTPPSNIRRLAVGLALAASLLAGAGQAGTGLAAAAGEAVRTVQSQLAARGVDIEVDGDFGPQTDAAVRAFQRANGLADNGIVGPHTWAALVATD